MTTKRKRAARTAKTPADADRIQLEAIDKKGQRRSVTLKATIIDGPEDEPPRLDEGPTSAADERDPFKSQSLGKHRIIDPPYNQRNLLTLKEKSNVLTSCVNSMVTNTVGFGWRLRERIMPDDLRRKFESEIIREKMSLLTWLESVHPTESFTALREQAKDDQHSCGNGYLELIENKAGRLVGLNHVHGHCIRLCERQKRAVKVDVPRIRPDKNFMIEDVAMWHRFRKFVMMVGTKPLFFKEAGDPRMLDRYTGEYGKDIPFNCRATSLLHFKNYFAAYAYGLPVWIGDTLSVVGSREAEEVNYATLRNNSIPSMFVIVENGSLTQESVDRLREWTEQQIQRSANRSKFIILEGETSDEGIINPTDFKIKVEPLKQLQQEDQLYQELDKNNRDKVRQAFRLPPIFVGRADDYTRATADTSRDIADEQVFAPERNGDDFKTNRFILLPLGSRFHVFRSNHPNITDDIELIRLMGIAEKSGGMTPRRADRIIRDVFGDDIGPMPTGIDLDKPFTITFAEAQQGGTLAQGNANADRVIDGLLNLREKIEEELEERLYHEE